MKKLLKYILLLSFAVALENQIWQNLTLTNGILTIIKTAAILTLFELLLKPIVKLLFLPINILTLGLFRAVINTLGLYLAVFLLNDFEVNNAASAAFSFQGYSIPAFNFTGFWAYLVSSVTISLFLYLFKSIVSKK